MAKPKSVNKSVKKPVSKSPAKAHPAAAAATFGDRDRSEEHTSELQSH